jgi:hypothetical protein
VHHQGVPLGQVRQRDAVLLAVAGDVQGRAVQLGVQHLVGNQVDPAGHARLPAGEPDRRDGPERALAGLAEAVGEVQLDGVRLDLEQRRAPLGIVTGQVGGGH